MQVAATTSLSQTVVRCAFCGSLGPQPADLPGLIHHDGSAFRTVRTEGKNYVSRMLARYIGDMNQRRNTVFGLSTLKGYRDTCEKVCQVQCEIE